VFAGLVAGSFNCAQAVIAPVLGAWSDARNIKEVLLFSTLLSVAGNALYLSATAQAQDEVPTDGQFSHALSMLFVARLIAGAGAGIIHFICVLSPILS
jgi:MFS family permease